jgi:hypothetical protein
VSLWAYSGDFAHIRPLIDNQVHSNRQNSVSAQGDLFGFGIRCCTYILFGVSMCMCIDEVLAQNVIYNFNVENPNFH